jgi:hypothetical protein
MASSLDAMTPLIEFEATSDLLVIFYAIKEHVEKNGIGCPDDTMRNGDRSALPFQGRLPPHDPRGVATWTRSRPVEH